MKIKKMVCLIFVSAIFMAAKMSMAQIPVPTGSTPTLNGGERLNPGFTVLGLSAGYPKTSIDVYFGLATKFDLGIKAAVTYNHGIGGNRQGPGFDLHVPLRWTFVQKEKLAGGLRFSPYFMIGKWGPSVSFGADVAFLIDIALPKVFKIIVGPELRTGIASWTSYDISGYDGGLWANVGMETFLARRFFLGVMLQGGGLWGTGGLGGEGVLRMNLFFGGKL